MTSDTDLNVLSKLESSDDFDSIHSLVSRHLKPVAVLITYKGKKKHDLSTLRSLAKQFLPFVNKSLSVLPKRLSKQNPSYQTPLPLFHTYSLCLDCLELFSSQLSCSRSAVHLQRIRLIYCLHAWGLFAEAEKEGFRVLETLKGERKSRCKLLPDVMDAAGDKELGMVLVESVVLIIKSVAGRQSRECEDYRELLSMVDEVRPWFSVLEAKEYERLVRVFGTYLGKCTSLLVADADHFNLELVKAFSFVSLVEYAKPPLRDQMFKFARRICSSIFSLEDKSLVAADALKCVLATISNGCKVETDSDRTQFLELIAYCANKCRTAGTYFCSTLAEHLNIIAHQVLPPYHLILKLYAMGLDFIQCDSKSQLNGTAIIEGDRYPCKVLCIGDDKIGPLNLLLESLGSYFCNVQKETSCSTHTLMCLSALKYLCQPLAELVNLEKKQIVSQLEACPVNKLFCIQNAFHQFCDNFLSVHCRMTDMQRDGFEDKITILGMALAGFFLSICLKEKIQESTQVVMQMIVSEWVQDKELKYLFTSLHNFGLLLYRNKQIEETGYLLKMDHFMFFRLIQMILCLLEVLLKDAIDHLMLIYQASEALKLSSRASWACVKVLCRKFNCKSESSRSHLSEDSVVNFVSEACTTSAFALEVLHSCGSLELGEMVVNILGIWSFAKCSFEGLQGPFPLIKQWVKIQCRLYNGRKVKDHAPTLFSLMSSIVVSKMSICTILEQELHAYEEMNPFYPDFCQEMQSEITSILLHDLYASRENLLQKSSILIRKGGALRAKGIENLEDCIQCLSEAISIMKKLCDEKSFSRTAIFHQLAVAYSLRALCTQEAEPNSKRVLQDVSTALDHWLNISVPDAGHELNSVSGSIVLLLYNVMDLLSVKGHTKMHGSIYQIMIRLCKLTNIAVEKCVAILWEARRLCHGLCGSPISDTFIMISSEEVAENCKHVRFWDNCLNVSQPLLVGLQQSLSFFFVNFTHVSNNHERGYWPEVTVKDVNEVISELLLINPVPNRSLFLAGYLYYDLSERLMSSGRMLEALTYAKEAYRFRAQLFQEKFRYSVEQQAAEYDAEGNMIQRLTCVPQNLHIVGRVANEIWSFNGNSMGLDSHYLSPWNALQCYLESIFQVGALHEIVGNGVEAETFLSWGRNIAHLQSLPLFEVAFSTALGNLYRKKGLWDLAEKEMKTAKQCIGDKFKNLSCLKCKLMLEASVDYQHGDLCRSLFARGGEKDSMEYLCRAENLYRSALEKLNHSEWKTLVSTEESSQQITIISDEDADEETNSKMDMRKSRTTKRVQKSVRKKQNVILECNSRVTRSKNRYARDQVIGKSGEAQSCTLEQSEDSNVVKLSTIRENGSVADRITSIDKVGKDFSCVCKKMHCWLCLHLDVVNSGLLRNFIDLRWEFARRRLLVRVVTGIGKCLGIHGHTHETHVVIMQSIDVLVSRNPINHSPAVCATSMLDMIGREVVGDSFAIERAAVLYHMCLFFLKNYHSRNSRVSCCNMSKIHFSRIVFWLKLSFVLCREVPILFEKVSQLLAAIHLISATSNDFPLESTCKALSENHWASYFHQASLGTNLSYQFFSNTGGRFGDPCTDFKGSGVIGSKFMDTDPCSLLRLAPESTEDFEFFVAKFFASLPSTSVICISLLGGAYANLLQELLLYPSCVHAWVLLSRMDSKNEPVVLLSPVKSVFEVLDDDGDSVSFNPLEYNLGRRWRCPWISSFTAVDSVAPEFKAILEENYMSSSFCPSEDTKKNRSLWWMRRKNLDHRLGNLLRNIEEFWLGPWRLLLLGDMACKTFDVAQKKLLRDLKSKCSIKANDNLLQLILSGGTYGLQRALLPYLSLGKGCYIAESQEICESSANVTDQLAFQLIHDAVHQLDEKGLTREPTVLVLDREVQMLPWESLPVLRNQEIYRMPSVSSLIVTLERSHYQEKVASVAAALPLIDPMDAFFLLNPSGDLSSTQVEFENWFRDQRLEGIAGSAPTAEELSAALKSHDLFIYFGHGSGEQYISKHEIQKLRSCAASLLMGCSSGALSLHGCYIPQGAPLSYLLAGSPVIVANLWEVTDKDIDRFAKAMLDAWLEARVESDSCDQCDVLAKEFAEMNIKRNSRRQGTTSKKTLVSCEGGSSEIVCYHRPRIAEFMGQAREACTLPFLIGASPVCYGVPTGIRKKKKKDTELYG